MVLHLAEQNQTRTMCLYKYLYIIYTQKVYTYIERERHEDMYTYMRTDTYIHTCLHTYIHTYIQTYRHADIHSAATLAQVSPFPDVGRITPDDQQN